MADETNISQYVANLSINVSPSATSQILNDGDGESPFATKDYVDTYSGKIDIIQKNGTNLPIVNKTVNVIVPTDTSDLTNNGGYIRKNVDNLEYYMLTTDINSELLLKADLSALTLEIDKREKGDKDIQDEIDAITGILDTRGDIFTHNVSEFATSSQGALADTALQPNDNISELVNNEKYIKLTSLSSSATGLTYTNTTGVFSLTEGYGIPTTTQIGLIDTSLQPSDVINNVLSDNIDLPLSANMGKELQSEIDTLKARGRFLALWNCSTGLAESNPTVSPRPYNSGDYYIIGIIAEEGQTNYQPSGSEYVIGVPSTTIETQPVSVDDVYYYDGTVWRLQINTQKEITFSSIAGQPTDNLNLASALNDKVTKNNAITAGTATKITYDTKGLVTAGTILSASDIPSLTLSKISDVTATASEINVLDGITASTAELNILDGVTATASEINILAGATLTTTELNYVDGVTSAIQTQLDSKEPKTNVTSKGTATLPVYFDSNGVAQTITSYEGNSATATKATQDASGNVITSTYQVKATYNSENERLVL